MVKNFLFATFDLVLNVHFGKDITMIVKFSATITNHRVYCKTKIVHADKTNSLLTFIRGLKDDEGKPFRKNIVEITAGKSFTDSSCIDLESSELITMEELGESLSKNGESIR